MPALSTVEMIQAATDGRGVDVAFEAAGKQDAVDASFAAVVPGGKVVLAGMPDEDKTRSPPPWPAEKD